jgi:hypothetical protein
LGHTLLTQCKLAEGPWRKREPVYCSDSEWPATATERESGKAFRPDQGSSTRGLQVACGPSTGFQLPARIIISLGLQGLFFPVVMKMKAQKRNR